MPPFDLETVDALVDDVSPVEAPVEPPAQPQVIEPTLEEIERLEICPTPPELALAICQRLKERGHNPRTIIEPSAGEGAFVRAARQTWPEAKIIAVEIRESCRHALMAAGADTVVISDFESYLRDLFAPVDLFLGNPPFSRAEDHIRLIFKINQAWSRQSYPSIAFLLKLAFYESGDRLDFWGELPESTMAPIVPRPGFKLNKKGKPGTDSQAYGLFVWDGIGVDGRATPRRLPHIVWEKPRAARGGRRRQIATTSADQMPTIVPPKVIPDLE